MRTVFKFAALWLLLLPTLLLADQKIWSDTKPAINLTHIFQGEINRRGKPTGYHALLDGKKIKTARIARIKGKPNKAGVYTAQVEIYDKREKKWKRKFSSMFPNDMKPQEIIDAIVYAYKHRQKGKSTPWRGPSGHGFQIEGYTLRNGRINTAYPVYVRDRK